MEFAESKANFRLQTFKSRMMLMKHDDQEIIVEIVMCQQLLPNFQKSPGIYESRYFYLLPNIYN